MKNPFNQENLLKELAQSNQQALDELFNHYYPRLYNFSRSFLKLEDGIDDILQEVFLKIWHHRKEIKRSESFNSYTSPSKTFFNSIRSVSLAYTVKSKNSSGDPVKRTSLRLRFPPQLVF